MTLTTGDARRPRMPTPSVGERKGARAMSIKDKIRVHIEIERENARKLEEWKKGGKARECK